MQADLEAELMRRVHDGEFARDVIGDLLARGAIASPKQGWRTLEKWCDKGWYNFGVSLDLGWMTEKAPCGRSVVRELPAWLAPAPSGHASAKVPQEPAKSPAEWREIIEQQLKELGGESVVGPPLLRELTFSLAPAPLPEQPAERKLAITVLVVGGAGAGEKTA